MGLTSTEVADAHVACRRGEPIVVRPEFVAAVDERCGKVNRVGSANVVVRAEFGRAVENSDCEGQGADRSEEFIKSSKQPWFLGLEGAYAALHANQVGHD